MSPCCRAASLPAKAVAPIRAPAASAWPSWPKPLNAWKPRNASSNSSSPDRNNAMTQQLQQIIDNAWENRASLSPKSAPKEIADAVEHVIAEMNKGRLRVATRQGVG